MGNKYVYYFAEGGSDGSAEMKELLGGKGANMAEMANMGVPVPPGFTISTEVCGLFYKNNREYPEGLDRAVSDTIKRLEKETGKGFGDPDNPLLVSVRSGAAQSMPGMMDTVLNLGINDRVAEGLEKKGKDPRFAWDSYRRFIQMFSNVTKGINGELFEEEISRVKKEKGVELDTELDTEDLKSLISVFKEIYTKEIKEEFPEDPEKQLWSAIDAVFGSWMNKRAVAYRKIHDIKGLIGTAVNVQSMVFGNLGNDSATGVCFTRDPSTGDNNFYGEYLVNAQGEDVVAGTRTPQKMSVWESRQWAASAGISEEKRKKSYPSLEEKMPGNYKTLLELREKLEKRYRDMQDMEFTIENGKLYILQTRNGKRTGLAAVKMAVDMVKEDLIDERTAVKRVDPVQLTQFLHPRFKENITRNVIATGLSASTGAGVGRAVFDSERAAKMAEDKQDVILVRIETSPEDIQGMSSSKGILTARGGATSHAAVVARQMGKPCVVGCSGISIDYEKKKLTAGETEIYEGDYISIDGTTGEVMKGIKETEAPSVEGVFSEILGMAEKFTDMNVRANADTPKDARLARSLGAAGIGLCRTEHMFFEKNRIKSMRRMILSGTYKEREKAIMELEPIQKEDFKQIFSEMEGLPVIIRLLDPPLHEFVPHEEKEQRNIASYMGITFEKVKEIIDNMKEMNPMLGFRGARLGIIYPEIYRMQISAITEAAIEMRQEGKDIIAEIMFPLIAAKAELEELRETADEIIKEKFDKAGVKADIKLGTMIEIPRAAITADKIAEVADFFSIGTNDLTQMTLGMSRDDAGRFIRTYMEKGISEYEPFQVLDQNGVGRLIETSVTLGRKTKPDLEIGICGEHGGEPRSVKFCYGLGLDYVSCSPLRVPIARLASAHASIDKNAG
ncbi:MAG: pyruvate, phosphate dikinase [Chitinivibrionales bacterium]